MSVRHTRSGAERTALRGRLHGVPPAVQVGREGLSPGVLASAEEALAARQTIKVRFGRNCSLGAREGGRELADRLGAELLGTIGRVALLYRPRPDDGEEPG